MRKSVLESHRTRTTSPPEENWLEVERRATVEVTSEDPAFPIESVFTNNGGWRAAENGQQVIRLVFDEPQNLHRIWLRFSETDIARTQQFALRWSGVGGEAEIVRQQWNFSPDSCREEVEDYRVDLKGVLTLELAIQPELTAGKAIASLAGWRLA